MYTRLAHYAAWIEGQLDSDQDDDEEQEEEEPEDEDQDLADYWDSARRSRRASFGSVLSWFAEEVSGVFVKVVEAALNLGRPLCDLFCCVLIYLN